MKKVELLAPAGNYQAFVGALHAGADAVYLGGEKFSARAYADNFTKEEICRAVRYAHIQGKKVYLTVNTLIKEAEFAELFEYIRPFYETGLDGIIIQDLGVWQYLKETFPDLLLHASTQMTITGHLGASFMKELGAARIVPARELSLAEIMQIKEQVDLELECFIHGAMCYSYSGMCLFSSILGGRSGNRGRCAQPCRLPYQVHDGAGNCLQKECYPLSLKDMCTIEYLPRLIEAGIDSFKIEGRMKKPEYAAGVTAIYRKYIDLYYEKGAVSYHVEQADMDMLRCLYIRSEIQTGYYERTNGREMITLQKPGYLGSDEKLLAEITKRYLKAEAKFPVTIRAAFHVNQPAVLTLEGDGIVQTSYGALVQPALKRPMEKEDYLKQLRKVGTSFVRIIKEEIDADENSFMPNVQINELRRSAIEAFESRLIEKNEFVSIRKTKHTESGNLQEMTCKNSQSPKLHVLVQNFEQLKIICQYPCDRVYIDSDCYMSYFDQISRYLEEYEDFAIYLALPFVIREKDISYFQDLTSVLDDKVKGFLVRNLESMSWVLTFRKNGRQYDIVTDTSLYCFNKAAAEVLNTYAVESYLPYELNRKECRQLIKSSGQQFSLVVYGRIPMMFTANCVKKTAGTCAEDKEGHQMYLTDRYQARFPVRCLCRHCYNIVYNCVSYSLHKHYNEIQKMGLFAIRLDFTIETEDLIKEILDFYAGYKFVSSFQTIEVMSEEAKREIKNDLPITEYTTGHYKRGVD